MSKKRRISGDFLSRRLAAQSKRPDREYERKLLSAIKARRVEVESLSSSIGREFAEEDMIYRFYHQSYKVYHLQKHTVAIVNFLRSLLPELQLNSWFEGIVADGTGIEWESSHNPRWLDVTRPILEAYFHARYFLSMIKLYEPLLEEPPAVLPSGWAAVLYLYNLREGDSYAKPSDKPDTSQ